MMRTALTLLTCAILAVLAPLASAQEDADTVAVSAEQALLGERFTIDLTVHTAPGVEVEIDPTGESWGGVEVREVDVLSVDGDGDALVHRLRVSATSFVLGTVQVRPRVLLVTDGLVTSRELPAFDFSVVPSLTPDTPLTLTSPPVPQSIAEATPWWVRPAIGAAVAIATIAVLALLFRLARRMRRRRPAPVPAVDPGPQASYPPLPEESQALTDPVAMYRAMATAVRTVLADRYALPARSLTTGELAGRMEAAGVDRWQARLVRGLLENCDAVVYSGYIPALDRRHADLNVAREIVEGAA